MLEGIRSPTGGEHGGGGSSSPRVKALPLVVGDSVEDFDIGVLGVVSFITSSSDNGTTTNINIDTTIDGTVGNSASSSGTINKEEEGSEGSNMLCVCIGGGSNDDIGVVVPAVIVRVYMHGLEGASDCLRTYTTFAEQVITQVL